MPRLSLALTALVILAAALLYPHLPNAMASHWNIAGEADGTLSKAVAVWLIPGLMLGLLGLRALVLRMDPLRANLQASLRAFDTFWNALSLFFAYVFGLMMAWNLGYRFPFGSAMAFALSGLAYAIGWAMPQAKRNWSFGVRTPWSLSSDVVWDKTHQFAGRAFKLSAAVSLVGILAPDTLQFAFILIPLLGAALASVGYSYIAFREHRP